MVQDFVHQQYLKQYVHGLHLFQLISNGRTHRPRTLKKPEYLIAGSQLKGPLGFGPIQFLMDIWGLLGIQLTMVYEIIPT